MVMSPVVEVVVSMVVEPVVVGSLPVVEVVSVPVVSPVALVVDPGASTSAEGLPPDPLESAFVSVTLVPPNP